MGWTAVSRWHMDIQGLEIQKIELQGLSGSGLMQCDIFDCITAVDSAVHGTQSEQ